MKRAGLKHKYFASIAFVVALMVLAVPILAQQGEIAAGRVAGAQAARASTNGTMWFAAGCLFGWLGLLVAYVIQPNPPATMLLGKSPEYVAAYTDSYRMTARGVQTGRAWTGCIVGTIVQVVGYVLLVAAAEATY